MSTSRLGLVSAFAAAGCATPRAAMAPFLVDPRLTGNIDASGIVDFCGDLGKSPHVPETEVHKGGEGRRRILRREVRFQIDQAVFVSDLPPVDVLVRCDYDDTKGKKNVWKITVFEKEGPGVTNRYEDGYTPAGLELEEGGPVIPALEGGADGHIDLAKIGMATGRLVEDEINFSGVGFSVARSGIPEEVEGRFLKLISAAREAARRNGLLQQ